MGYEACDRATPTPHSVPHANTSKRASVVSIEALCMTAVEHRAHTCTAAAVTTAVVACNFSRKNVSRIEAVRFFKFSFAYVFALFVVFRLQVTLTWITLV